MKLTSAENDLFAVLFACGEPMETERLAQSLQVSVFQIERMIEHINEVFTQQESPLEILLLKDYCQLCTRPQYAGLIQNALAIKKNATLSSAALEVLAITAYHEPVTRTYIEQVRGVDSSGVIGSLVEKGLMAEAGRLDLPGKPIAYVTTPHFLRVFGLSSLQQLPDVALSDTLDEHGQLKGQEQLF